MSGDLVAFLRARLDEDEAVAKTAAHIPGKHWEARSQGHGRERDGVLWDDDLANVIAWFDDHMDATVHAARHDPWRVLREVEAKRKILDEYAAALAAQNSMLATPAGDQHVTYEWENGRGIAAYNALRGFAGACSDHPDYDPSWGPA